jgi:hypothetical protein
MIQHRSLLPHPQTQGFAILSPSPPSSKDCERLDNGTLVATMFEPSHSGAPRKQAAPNP